MRAAGREPFDDDDLELLSAFAAQASVALELARAQQRERDLQVQADRDRIARDLHDHVVQRIFATALSLDRLSRSLEADRPEAAARVARSVDELDGTMAASARRSSSCTGRGRLAGGAPRRLAEVVRRSPRAATCSGPADPGRASRSCLADLVPDLVAVVRELVTNVVRHAGARR